MAINRSAEIERRIQAYADSSEDSGLIAAFGTPGSKIMYNGESEDTGQQWLEPGYMRGLTNGFGEVSGSWTSEDFDLVAQTSITLAQVPANAGSLQVFINGTLSRKVVSISGAGQYTWTAGSKLINFATATGWAHVVYEAVF